MGLYKVYFTFYFTYTYSSFHEKNDAVMSFTSLRRASYLQCRIVLLAPARRFLNSLVFFDSTRLYSCRTPISPCARVQLPVLPVSGITIVCPPSLGCLRLSLYRCRRTVRHPGVRRRPTSVRHPRSFASQRKSANRHHPMPASCQLPLTRATSTPCSRSPTDTVGLRTCKLAKFLVIII